ncbi:hypothetical protein F9Z45_06490 [Hydrogenophaga sp. PBL-H3]|nr:hypothetical protein F9Z45_06490 [Hydrogenophaga sp. PBL-H3]
MHNAPSVVYPVGRCVFYAVLLAMIALVCALIGAMFLSGVLQRAGQPWGWTTALAGVLSWMAWLVLAVASWLRSPEGVLKWDSSSVQEDGGAGGWLWCSSSDAEPISLSQVACVLDLQRQILLCIRSVNTGQRWIWVERRSNQARWNDLRRALVSSRA